MVRSAPANQRIAFTLLELLVVIAIILIVTTLTLLAYRGIASDMRMSAAVQDVTGVMEQARSRAIRDGKVTIVALRPRTTSGGDQIVEAVVGQSSGETFRWTSDANNGSSLGPSISRDPLRAHRRPDPPRDAGEHWDSPRRPTSSVTTRCI